MVQYTSGQFGERQFCQSSCQTAALSDVDEQNTCENVKRFLIIKMEEKKRHSMAFLSFSPQWPTLPLQAREGRPQIKPQRPVAM